MQLKTEKSLYFVSKTFFKALRVLLKRPLRLLYTKAITDRHPVEIDRK